MNGIIDDVWTVTKKSTSAVAQAYIKSYKTAGAHAILGIKDWTSGITAGPVLKPAMAPITTNAQLTVLRQEALKQEAQDRGEHPYIAQLIPQNLVPVAIGAGVLLAVLLLRR